jgi:hypothetical protein
VLLERFWRDAVSAYSKFVDEVMRLVTPGDNAPASVHRYLLPHEQQVITVRRHPSFLSSRVASAVGGLAVADFAPAIVRGQQSLVFLIWALVALLFLDLIMAMARWSNGYVVITNQRLLICSGLFGRNVDDTPLDELRGIGLHRSVPARLFGWGSLVLQGRPVVDYIPYPEQLYLELKSMMYPFTSGAED